MGAATGGYTLGLARRGYQVTAVDLSATLLGECRKRIAAERMERNVRFVVADARALGFGGRHDYDAVLLMGPLYHLVDEADRQTALREACDHLRPGGILVSSFLNRLGILGDLMKENAHWIEDQPYVRSMLERGRCPSGARRGGFRGYFALASEIAPLHEAIGLKTLAVAAVEPAISADDGSYNRLHGRQRDLWLELLFEIGTAPTLLDASRHLLYVGTKT